MGGSTSPLLLMFSEMSIFFYLIDYRVKTLHIYRFAVLSMAFFNPVFKPWWVTSKRSFKSHGDWITFLYSILITKDVTQSKVILESSSWNKTQLLYITLQVPNHPLVTLLGWKIDQFRKWFWSWESQGSQAF